MQSVCALRYVNPHALAPSTNYEHTPTFILPSFGPYLPYHRLHMLFTPLRTRLWTLFLALTSSLLIAACGGSGSSAPAPSNFTAVAGNNQVTLNWNADPDVTYWVLYSTSTTGISTDSIPAQHVWATNVSPPHTVTGLVNGTSYAFTVNGRKNGGPGGSGAPSQLAVPRPAGVSWTSGSGLGSADVRGLAYGATSDTSLKYLAAGQAGALYQSADGLAWSALTGPSTQNHNASLYALSKFFTAGASGAIWSSSDLSTWSAGTSNTSQNLHALASNGALVVAAGENGSIVYSSDGTTWTPASSVPNTSNHLYGLSYSNNLWLAVGANGSLWTSSDAKTWTAQTSGTSTELRAVTGMTLSATTSTPATTVYVAAGAQGTLLYSTDAITWSLQTVGSNTLYALNASANQILAVGAAGTALTSPNGTTWTAQTTGTSSELRALLGSATLYFTAGNGGSIWSSK